MSLQRIVWAAVGQRAHGKQCAAYSAIVVRWSEFADTRCCRIQGLAMPDFTSSEEREFVGE